MQRRVALAGQGDATVLGRSVDALVGAGEHGVGLLSELEAAAVQEATTADESHGAELAPARPRNAIASALFAANATERITEPRMGLIRRLQLMTLRTSARHPRSVDAPVP